MVGVEIPCEQLLMKIKNSDCYMYPTATLTLDKHGHYENIISKFFIKKIILTQTETIKDEKL